MMVKMHWFRRRLPLIFFLFALTPWFGTAAAPVPSVSIGQNFTGSTFGVESAGIPADANGAIGPQHFVEFINGVFAVYNKTNGQSVKISDVDFWSAAGVTLPNGTGVADPRIIYDPTVQRW